ncbi:sulfite exporter TauE/SafE family protein [Mesorhizobium sp. ES1-4]|uniref:sulfite exporter TauE/SafE family protein n=1 Tax=Mesorhizobium sp. ES1-4 TaxID=2876627 RepID=UPI001CCC17E0|nr:sulfite exporter TauE/SafE family protein [Mesorhizobium sp. ES1-4]MBZ9795216.1 sulfite exporter TauE/SafE family protein [Mesorhizobium sp. ES1-4]
MFTITSEFLVLAAVGFLAQLVDGGLGMAFGLITTTALLSLGIPPAPTSAAVHSAEVATTGASALSHLFHKNVDYRLLLTLGVPGVLGGILGAHVLSNIDGGTVRPFISAYLLVMGLFIVLKAAKSGPPKTDAKIGYAGLLGLVSGFLDAIGGAGWGPIATSTLLGSGHSPRKAIGSVNAAEFFVTLAVATTFFIELATAHVEHIAALIIGGLLAAPFGGYVARHVRPRALMAAIGVLVSALALYQLFETFG